MKLNILREWLISWSRTTVVPTLAAIIIQWLMKWDFKMVSESDLTVALTIIISALWYAVFRALELISTNPKVKKWAGILLGYPRSEVKV